MFRSLLTLTAVLLVASPTAALARQCADRDQMVKLLQTGHGETLAGRGLLDKDALYEVWRSDETGSWTILRTRADGLACIMAAGTHWLPGIDGPKGIPG